MITAAESSDVVPFPTAAQTLEASGLTVDLTLVPDFGASPRRDPAGPDVAFGRGA